MKIAFVTSHINRSTQWIWFSDEMQKRGIQHIHIIINEFKPLLYDDLREGHIKVYYLKYTNKFSLITNFFRIIKIFLEQKIDVVHTELPYGNLLGLAAAYLCRIKMRITTCENTTWFSDFDSKKQELIDLITYFFSKRIIALTQDSYDFLNKHFNIPPRKLRIIHHSLKSSEYLDISDERVAAMRTELKIPSGIFIIGMVARFEYWKGHVYAIEAMKKLVAEFPHVRLYIFGSKGESFDLAMSKIKEYNLEDFVIYKGFVRDNIVLYKIFDIHLHIPITLQSETFGINIMEGMISGCAQVLTLSGISSFTARDGVNCLIVPYQSTEGVYQALKRLIRDDELRKKIGAQAKEDAIKHFRYSEKFDEHLELYEELKAELGS